MTENNQRQLGNTLWAIADQLRGAMNADDFRDYMLAFLFLRYLSDNYQQAAKKELGRDYPDPNAIGNGGRTSLSVWYEQNPDDVSAFEKQMRLKAHYVIRLEHLWASIAHMARTEDGELLNTLQAGFKYIENESFENTFSGLFSEINLGSDKLGKTYADRNAKLCKIITRIAEGLAEFSTDSDTLGDAYEYLIGQFAAGSGKKAGEFYTPQRISDILSAIVALDSQEPKTGKRKHLASVMDFACGWRCCTARSKSLTSLCRLQSHPAQYVSGIPSAAILLSISHPIRCSTRCLANVRARISGPMIAL